ncbi:MAG: diguanylate cyclase [Acidobacteriota bacterium]
MTRAPGTEEIAALKAEIRAIFNEDPVNLERMIERVSQLSWSVGPGIYSGLLLLLGNLRFEEEEARRHWQAMRAHRRDLEEKLGSPVALRVAVLDYLIATNRASPRARLLDLVQTEQPNEREMTDPVTGLHSMSFFSGQLPRELGRAHRFDLSVSLVHTEIDDFAAITERFGLSIGSVLLREIAGILTKCIRTMDYAARVCGSEFALLLTETDRMGAYYVADRIRQKVEEFYLERQINGRPFEITVSSGVASFPQDAETPKGLIRRASEAFYNGRARGRGGVAIHHRERREYIRLETPSENLQVTLMPEGETTSSPAEMKNISSGGVLFESDRPIELGRMVQIAWSHERDSDQVVIPGRVVRIERFGDDKSQHYEIGVLFDLVVEEQIEGVIDFFERFIAPQGPPPPDARRRSEPPSSA